MRYSILIVGAGQLGSRYLQGLSKVSMPLDIIVSDVSPESLARAEVRWQEADGHKTSHHVRYMIGLSELPPDIDLAIIATSADVRAKVVVQLTELSAVRYWVLEKVLAQSDVGLDLITSVLNEKTNAWVNTPRRIMRWYNSIKQATPHRTPTIGIVKGSDWGLACNAVHCLDLMAWWTGETLVEIQTEQLGSQWHLSKRPRFWEVYGTLIAKFKGGSALTLHCSSSAASSALLLAVNDKQWTIDEVHGVATRSDGLSIPGCMEFQSTMTTALVESILTAGTCNLPTLAESVALHRPLLQALLSHWNSTMSDQLSLVPIT